MQNFIEREIIIKASRPRIYEAISNPEKVVLWFPDSIEGEYAVGEQPVFSFGEQARSQIYIVDAVPHEYFAFRWVPGSSHFVGDVLAVATTLVEFRIAELPGGQCKLTLTETGFADLPAEIARTSFDQNSGGWDFMLERLHTHFKDA